MTPLHTVRTMCPMNCHPTLCGMLVDVEDGSVKAVRGDPDNPDSRGFLCIRGQAAREIIGNPKRIVHPLRRAARSGSWQRTTWEDALDRIDRTELQDLFQPWLDRLAHQLNRGTG